MSFWKLFFAVFCGAGLPGSRLGAHTFAFLWAGRDARPRRRHALAEHGALGLQAQRLLLCAEHVVDVHNSLAAAVIDARIGGIRRKA